MHMKTLNVTIKTIEGNSLLNLQIQKKQKN